MSQQGKGRGGCALAVGGCAAVGALLLAGVLVVVMAVTSITGSSQQMRAGVVGQCEGDADSGGGGSAEQAAASDLAESEIPEDYLKLYKETGKAWDLEWELLAAVGWKESTHGTDPNAMEENSVGALGPMQFIPAAWQAHGLKPGEKDGDPPPLEDRLAPETAIWSAAHKLTDQGARNDPRGALVKYYGADVDGYADSVMEKASEYGEGGFEVATVDNPDDDGDGGEVVACPDPGSAPGQAPEYDVGDLSGRSDRRPCEVEGGSPFPTGPITPLTCAMHRTIVANFNEGLRYSGNCYRELEDGGEHPRGRACDYMTSPGGSMPTKQQKHFGDKIADYAKKNYKELGVEYIIWYQRIWSPERANEGWRKMGDRGSVTENHMDHVHISVIP